MVEQDKLKYILEEFQILGEIVSTHQLLYKDDCDGLPILRDIIGVETTDGSRYVIKIVSEPNHPLPLIHRQIAFSETLRTHGAPVARYYRCSKGWTDELQTEVGTAYVSCEDFVGNPVQSLDTRMMRRIGALLGKLHRLSLENQCRVESQKTYQEVISHSRYRKIWRDTVPKSVPEELYRRIEYLHDSLMPYVEALWPKLPLSAVQADIYATNNYAELDDGLVAYDFNLAADEVLIGDLLISWFRTTIHPDMWQYIHSESSFLFWKEMLDGYCIERPLTRLEEQSMPMLYPLMAAIYASTLAYQFEEVEEYDHAAYCIQKAHSVLEDYWADPQNNVFRQLLCNNEFCTSK